MLSCKRRNQGLPESKSCQHWCLAAEIWLPPVKDCSFVLLDFDWKLLQGIAIAQIPTVWWQCNCLVCTESPVLAQLVSALHLKDVATPDNRHNTDRGSRALHQTQDLSTGGVHLLKNQPRFAKQFKCTFATFPGTTVGSLARASSPNIRIRRSPSWTKTLRTAIKYLKSNFWHHLELLSGKVFVPHLGEKEGDCSWVDHRACRVVRRDRTLSAKK